MTNKKAESGLANYKDEFIDCRESHLWRWLTDWHLVRGRSGQLLEFTRIRKCERCGTEAHRRFDGKTGRVIPNATRYIYPDGYLVDEKHRFDTGEARLEALRRAGLLASRKKKES